jgi:DNA primase
LAGHLLSHFKLASIAQICRDSDIHNANGELVAYAGRAIDEVEPKYKFPVGFRKSLELCNLDRVTGELSVVLVEGFFDCIRVTQTGFPCGALMGCATSRTQEEVIARQFAHAVVMLDGGIAGQETAYEIAERLRRIIFQVDVVNLNVGTQPDHLREEELRDMLRGTVTIQKRSLFAWTEVPEMAPLLFIVCLLDGWHFRIFPDT